MNTNDKLKLLEMILDKTANDDWYIKDVVDCYNEFYKLLTK